MKFSKYAKLYVVATQGMITMILFVLFGFFGGKAISEKSMWPGVLAAVGAILGLINFIYTLLKLQKEEDKNESKNR